MDKKSKESSRNKPEFKNCCETKFHEQVISDARMFLIKHKKAFAELAK